MGDGNDLKNACIRTLSTIKPVPVFYLQSATNLISKKVLLPILLSGKGGNISHIWWKSANTTSGYLRF